MQCDFPLPVVLRSSHEPEFRKILRDDGILQVTPGLAGEVFLLLETSHKRKHCPK